MRHKRNKPVIRSKKMGIESTSELVFVGDWSSQTRSNWDRPIVLVLIESELPMYGYSPSASNAPRITPSADNVSDCEAMVVKDGGNITVRKCP